MLRLPTEINIFNMNPVLFTGWKEISREAQKTALHALLINLLMLYIV